MTFDKLLLFFLLTLPLFGKTIDYRESVLFFGFPILFLIYLSGNSKNTTRHFTKKYILFILALLVAMFFSVIFSRRIGISYYSFFCFLNILVIASLSLISIPVSSFFSYFILFSTVYSLLLITSSFNFITLPDMPFGDNFIKQIWGHSFASGFIVLSIPLLLDRLSRKTSSTKFTYLCLFINLAALYLSNSRSAIIALLVSLFLIKTKSSPLSVIKKTTIIISVIVLVLVSLMSVYLPSSTTKKNFTGNRFEYWRESLQGIVRYPVFGFGPGNFAIINDKYQKAPQSRTDNPHNFILELLSEDGIIFSFIFFFWIYQGLKFQAGHNHLGFNLAITLAVNSLFDMTLSFPALMIIFIYLVFHDYPEFINNKAQLPSRLNYLLITILLSLFFLSKTSSDFLYLTRQYRLSILFDPFNINSRLEYLSQLHSHQARKAEINRIIYLFRDDPVIYDRLIAVTPLPEAEPYYYRLIELSSNPSLDNYISLLNFYEAHLDSYHTQSLQLLRQINSRYDKKDINWDVIIRISSAAYKTANTYWQLGDTSTALELYKIPVKYFPEYTPYQIELANVYWSLDRQDLAVRQLSVECQKARSSNIVCRDFLNGINSGVKHFTQPGHMITN